MPRERQAVTAEPNQPYGDNQEQRMAQKAIPLPQGGRPTAPSSASAPAAPPGAPAQQGPPVDPMQAAIGFARDYDPGITPLTAPSQRPGEPVQTGLSMGPGAGPDIFNQPTRAMAAADVLTKLAQSSENTAFLDLAARIRAAGGMR